MNESDEMAESSGKILFAGGGTGGHIYPALATIEALSGMGIFEILYVGGYRGLENDIIPKKNIPYRSIWISGFHRRFTVQNILFPFKLVVSLMQSRKILRKFNPDVVVGTGGYVSGPVVYLAAKKGIPTLIQEQDSYPGVTTRLLAKQADRICVPYPEVGEFLPEYQEKIRVTGNPVRSSLKMVSKFRAAKQWGFDPQLPVIFVFGGSQGAQCINRAITSVAGNLIEKFNVQILWQTGPGNLQTVQSEEIVRQPGIKILPFIEEMNLAYSAADIIVSRAGAITLAELAIAQKPCILVPYPFAAAKHQEHNAKTIEEKGAALVVLEGDGFESRLLKNLKKLLSDEELRREMRKKWENLSRPDAARNISREIVDLMES